MKKKTSKPKDKLAKWDWPYHGRGELSCPHSVGHGGIHGCDGCCRAPGFKEAWAQRLAEGYQLKR